MASLSGAPGSSFTGERFPSTQLDRGNGLEIHSDAVSRVPVTPTMSLALWPHVVNDRGLRKEIVGNRLEVAVAQIFETVLDGFPHRALDLALLGRSAGFQELDDVSLFPLTDAGARVRRDVWNELAVGAISRSRQP